MDAFWSWVIRVNARTVFYLAAAISLVLVLVGWLVLEGTGDIPPIAELPPAGEPGALEVTSANGSRLTAPETPINPFHSTHLAGWLAAQRAQREAKEDQVLPPPPVTPATPVVTPIPPPEPAPTPPPPPPRLVQLLYRGMLQRTDGERFALVEHPASKQTAYYRRGDLVDGFRLADFDRQSMHLIGKDHGRHNLAVGRPAELQEAQP